MNAYVPSGGVQVRRNIPYSTSHTSHRGGKATSMDVHLPDIQDGPLPVVVWIHGGAWISGSKEDVAPQLQMIAARGNAAVGLNYSIALNVNTPRPFISSTTRLRRSWPMPVNSIWTRSG